MERRGENGRYNGRCLRCVIDNGAGNHRLAFGRCIYVVIRGFREFHRLLAKERVHENSHNPDW
jgi:hypothetical protein